ncbi:PilN domain-containing protein [Tahibacter caeni]|uniref:PilN domain-containing protein n=1 Tax=Tahibacter caeni TaxID=1453545 RepID=UPI002147C5DB
MSAAASPGTTLRHAALAFVAAGLPLAVAAGYYHYREHRYASELHKQEAQLAALNTQLEPIGDLDRLRSEMLARKQIVDVLQEPQHGLQAAFALAASLPSGAGLLDLDVDEKQLTLQARCADAATTDALLQTLKQAGFSEARIALRQPGAPAGTEQVRYTATIDPARFAELARAAGAAGVQP